MRLLTAGFCMGCSLLWLQPRLFELLELALASVCLLLIILVTRTLTRPLLRVRSLLIGLVLGGCWANLNASWQLGSRLPFSERVIEAKLEGHICSIPVKSEHQTRFVFCLDSLQVLRSGSLNLDSQRSQSHLNALFTRKPERLSLVRYHVGGRFSSEGDLPVNDELFPPHSLLSGERWKLVAKLKPPYSLLNTYGFDLERWSLINALDGFGYVVDGEKIQQTSLLSHPQFLRPSLAHFRFSIIEQLRSRFRSPQFTGWHLALVAGYRQALSEQDFQLLKDTGTAHLIAISGLHIGLVFFWAMITVRFLWSRSYRLCNWLPAEQVALYSGLILTWLFTGFTGAELPTQRAAIAISLFVLSRSRLIFWTPYKLFNLTLLVLLIHEPLNVLSEGFWLTVTALLIILLFSQIKGRRRWYHWLYLQGILSVVMTSFSAVIFGGLSINAWLANLIAIPLISFVILPLDLLGLCFLPVTLISETLFSLSDIFLNALVGYLNLLQEFLPSLQIPFDLGWLWLAIIFSVLLIRIFNLPWVVLLVGGNIVILGGLVIGQEVLDNNVEIYFMDVGQGLSVIIHHQDKWIIYDTGFGHQQFSVASQSLMPFLSRQGVSEIDLVIISHSDNDHSGGFETLKRHFKLKRVVFGEPLVDDSQKFTASAHDFTDTPVLIERMADGIENSIHYEACNETREVIGEIKLYWRQVDLSGNNASCVLAVEVFDKRLLLTGDIEKPAELKLLSQSKDLFPADIISLPHHGSKTSSTWSFIAQARPDLAVASSGYLNRFGHPAREVVSRYQLMQSQVLSTWRSGMITIQISSGKPLKIKQYRRDSQKFWNHSSSSDNRVIPVVN